MESVCSNCDTEHISECKYCPECGQRAALHRLTLHDIIHEAIHYFTHADKGIFQLIKALAFKRGEVAREYISGRRKKYFPPLNFLLIIAAIFVFMATLNLGTPTAPAVTTGEQMELFQYRAHLVNVYVTRYSNIMALLSLPITSFFYWLFYRKRPFNYIEHLVAGMYMLGFTLLVYTFVLLPIENIFNIQRNAMKLFFLLFQLVYFTMFYASFMSDAKNRFSWRSFSATFVGILFWVILTTAVIQFYIMTGFWGLAA
ncbi:MAG: DUF3667 domain-containing protein [Flavobacterium sp.]|nr:DUF3667 domain-containing protein [Flavobacterium sp.]